MYCSKCGYNNDENSKFCQNCGGELEKVITTDNSIEPTIIDEPVNCESAIKKVKEVFSSKLMLFVCILLSFNLFFAFASFMSETNLASSDFVSGILLVISGWLIYSSCKKSGDNHLSVAGFNVLKAYSIVAIVIFSIVIFFTFIVTFALLFLQDMMSFAEVQDLILEFSELYSLSLDNAMDVLMTASFIVIFVLDALLVLAIIFQAKTIKSVSNIKNAVKSNCFNCKISNFVVVCLYILFGFGCVSFLTSLFSYDDSIHFALINYILLIFSSAVKTSMYFLIARISQIFNKKFRVSSFNN